MTHIYHITGMTCSGCQATVQKLLSAVPGVEDVQVDLSKCEARISMSHHIPEPVLASALKDHPKYRLSAMMETAAPNPLTEESEKSWLATYKPILLIFAYLLGLTLIPEWVGGKFHWHNWMNNFMAGFFLAFSFFKMLDLRGFAESYAMYDIVAKKWKQWGYFYAFLELGLGFAFLSGFQPLFTNLVTLVLMTVSITGVLQSVMNKRKIQCACLGAVFALPMSTVTILEDLLMILMSGIMLLSMLS